MDLSGSSEASSNDVATIIDSPESKPVAKAKGGAPKAPPAGEMAAKDSSTILPQPYPVEVDHSRDALLTDFGKDTLKDRYLLPG
jgi:ribonucleoside-diphosphate reductase alpha chain